jgi:hypothetical protein
VRPTAARANCSSQFTGRNTSKPRNRGNRNPTHVLVPQVLLRNPLDLIGGNGVNITLNLLRGESLPGGDHLSADLTETSATS